MSAYYRPLLSHDLARPDGALILGHGPQWFTHVERLTREGAPEVLAASAVPQEVLARITAPRAPIAGLTLECPRLMGILNVTPDSFSDGGDFYAPDVARAHAAQMIAQGADMIDVGGESTRPGAVEVPAEEEIRRTAPVIAALAEAHPVPLSIDTRKAAVAEAALAAGALLVNDIAGFAFDPALAPLVAARQVPVCLMHSQGLPETMQANPSYDHVVLDVYDFLAKQVAMLEGLGLDRGQILVDPGIGFGKTEAHNLALLARLSLFHSLGCPLLLGVSRKRFIGEIGRAPEPKARVAGSVAVALAGVAQGAHMLRVHDVFETRSALSLWQASIQGEIS